MTERTINVPLLARSYRRLVLWFGAQLVLNVIALPLNAMSPTSTAAGVLALLALSAMLGTLVALAIYAHRTATALGSSAAVLWAIAMFVPCANVITLLALSSKATHACRANGIPVGFLGPKLPAVSSSATRPPAATNDPH